MTSIIAHKILQALLMLATSNECPPADWYEFETKRLIVIQKCAIPLADHMSETEARAFYKAARRLSGRL